MAIACPSSHTYAVSRTDIGGQETLISANAAVSWKEVEEAIGFVGPTDRAEPVEMALGAVAACLCNSIALNAPRNGIDLDGLEIKVRTNIDPSELFEVRGPESHTSCMPKITTEVKVKGDLSDEQLATIERLIHYSPVHGMVEYANEMESKVTKA